MKAVMIGAKKMRFDQYAGHCIVSNFRLHRDSYSQILTATENSSAPTSARSILIRLSSLDWPSWLLLPAASALSCHLLADHPVSLHIVDQHWWKLCHPVVYLWSSFFSHTHDTCYFQNSGSQLSYIYTAYTSLACVAFATILHFQTLATCQATTWLVVTKPAAGHPSSVLSRAFHQSKFAIVAICPHALAGYVLWSGPETQLCFRVHLPPLAGSSTTVHSSLILQNAPPYYVCSPLSARQVASV